LRRRKEITQELLKYYRAREKAKDTELTSLSAKISILEWVLEDNK